MLNWDFTQSALMHSNAPVRAPTEAEMFVLLAAMLLVEGIPYTELRRRPLVLTHHNCRQVAEMVEWCLSPLSPDIGTGEILRERLRQLGGATVEVASHADPMVDARKGHA